MRSNLSFSRHPFSLDIFAPDHPPRTEEQARHRHHGLARRYVLPSTTHRAPLTTPQTNSSSSSNATVVRSSPFLSIPIPTDNPLSPAHRRRHHRAVHVLAPYLAGWDVPCALLAVQLATDYGNAIPAEFFEADDATMSRVKIALMQASGASTPDEVRAAAMAMGR